jgi:putative peptidoglycan lipid II flippase
VLLARIALGCAVMVAVVLWLDRPADWWLAARTGTRVGWLAVVVGSGIGAYVLALLAGGLRPRHLRLESSGRPSS